MSRPRLIENTENADVLPSIEHRVLLNTIELELLGERLRRARLEKKITQRSLVNQLFTSAYLSSLELGKTRPTYSTLVSLAERLDKSVEYFLRPTSELVKIMDQEQAQVLEMRLALLTAQTALANVADERAMRALNTLSLHLARLSNSEQAHYHYLQAHYHILQNEPNLAIPELEQARKDLQNLPPLELAVLVEIELGSAYYTQGRLMPALTQYLVALEKLREVNAKERVDPKVRSKLFQAIANCYLSLNDWQPALNALEEALGQSDEEQNPPSQAEQYYTQATTYAEQGDYQRASLNLGRSLQIYEASQTQLGRVKGYNTLAQLYFQLGQYEQAEVQASNALEVSRAISANEDQCSELSALITLAAICHKQAKNAEASHYLEQSLALVGQAGKGCSKAEELGRLYQTAGEIEAGAGRNEQAETYYRRAIETVEGEPRLAGNLADIYHSYGQQLKSWGDMERAFEYLEKAFRQRELSQN